MTEQHTPLTAQQLAEIEAKAAELRGRIDRKNPWPSDNESYWTTEGWKAGTRNALDKLHVEALAAEVRRLRARVAELEGPAVEARAALAALCYDLDDPGTAALGALYLLSQAIVGVDAPRDDAALALAQHDAQVLRKAAETLEATDRDDDAINLLYLLADDVERPEETHVVADDSDDPEHVDDCPGCEAAASAVSGAADSRPWVPCSPEWLAAMPKGACADEPRRAGDGTTVSHYHPAAAPTP